MSRKSVRWYYVLWTGWVADYIRFILRDINKEETLSPTHEGELDRAEKAEKILWVCTISLDLLEQPVNTFTDFA